MATTKSNTPKKDEGGTVKHKNPKSTSVTYTKKETDTPQFKERDRSADARAAQNKQ
jgi:hypothetical protein